jgi:flagellar biosynthesis protein FlhF
VEATLGRPGAGKTTTLTKLAAASGLAERRPAQVLSMDPARIAAAEQPRALAGIFGIGLQALATTGALSPTMEERRHKKLIPIGTPGFSPKDLDMGLDPALFLAAHADMDTHPVLAATMNAADPTSAIDRFEMFRPSRLLLTRLDQTETFGSIPNQATRTAKPVSFLAAGQQIPEDLEPASRERMVDLAPGRHGTASLAAARRPWLQERKKQTTNAFVSHKHGIARRGAGTVDHGTPATGASDRQTNSRTAAGKRQPRGSDFNRCARPHLGH